MCDEDETLSQLIMDDRSYKAKTLNKPHFSYTIIFTFRLLESILVKAVGINLYKKKKNVSQWEEGKLHWGEKKNNRGPYPFDFRSMQPGMRVALATTFWLAVLVAGTVGHHPAGRLIFDQYSSPFDPHQYGVYRRAGGQPDWKDQDPVEKNHPFDPSINPPRSITNTGYGTLAISLRHPV